VTERRRLTRFTRNIRVRVTAVAGVVITATVVAGLLALYQLQVNSVHRTVDGQLRTYATQIEQSAVAGHWPRPLALSTLDSGMQAQVLDSGGTVLAATGTLLGAPAVYTVAPGSSVPVRARAATGLVPTDALVVVVRATVDGRAVVVITCTGTGLLQTINDEQVRHLLLALPLILLAAALAIWLVVGRALGPVERIRGAVTDITLSDLSRRVPETGSSDEIGRLAATMNAMLARLDESARRQRRFVAYASHELRTPLAAVRTTLEVAIAHPDEAPWPQVAERAVEQSARLETLIDQLLLLARADEHGLAAAVTEFALRPVVASLVRDLGDTGLDISVTVPGGLAVTGHEQHLRRALGNVVSNAARYAERRIAIDARHLGEQDASGNVLAVRITISDDGPGIPEADRERVLGRFVRLDSSRSRGTGSSGLGLAIASEIVTAHGGRVEIGESAWRGVCVTVELPAPGPTPRESGSIRGGKGPERRRFLASPRDHSTDDA
jgi:signal transduction histidine kinase